MLALLNAFPDAAVHTLLYDAESTFPEFRDAQVITSPLNRFAPLRRRHRVAMPLLAAAASRMRVDADVTVISTSGWAHGFDVRGCSVVYCHNPARWLYQQNDYLGEQPRLLTRLALAGLAPSATSLGPRCDDAPRFLPGELERRPRARAARPTASRPRPSFLPRWFKSTASGKRSAPSNRGSTSWCRGCCRTRTSTGPSRRSNRYLLSACWSSAAGPRSSGCGACSHRTWPSSPTSATASCAGLTDTAQRSSPRRSRISG